MKAVYAIKCIYNPFERVFFCVKRFWPITRVENNSQEKFTILHVPHIGFLCYSNCYSNCYRSYLDRFLNKELHYLMDKCFPVTRVVMSSSDPPWITPPFKYLLRKKTRATDNGHVHKVGDLSSKVYKLIGENRKNWGRSGAQGSLRWWRRVDEITLRKLKSQP